MKACLFWKCWKNTHSPRGEGERKERYIKKKEKKRKKEKEKRKYVWISARPKRDENLKIVSLPLASWRFHSLIYKSSFTPWAQPLRQPWNTGPLDFLCNCFACCAPPLPLSLLWNRGRASWQQGCKVDGYDIIFPFIAWWFSYLYLLVTTRFLS